MDCDDPDFKAFESNLRATIQGKESGKSVQFLPEHIRPSLGQLSSKENAQHESHKGTSSHGQSDFDDLPHDHETFTEWKFKGYLYFAAACWPADKIYEYTVQVEVEEQYLPAVPAPIHSMEIFNNLAAENNRELLKLHN